MTFTEHYRDIKRYKSENVRGALRHVALNVLSAWDVLSGREKVLRMPRIQFFCLHHVFRDEEKRLEDLLRELSRHHSFISYSDAVDKLLNGTIDGSYVSFSLDDGLKNNIRAAEIFSAYGASACFFVNPDVLEMSDIQSIRRHCEDRLHFPLVEFMDWKDVEQLLTMGHEIGSHTMGHINVAQTEAALFAEDCRATYEILQKKCGVAKHFAYPYGRFSHFTDVARQIVFDSGFISCATAERGCHINHSTALRQDQLCILRDHILPEWPVSHIMYFLVNNARKASVANNLFPY
jgi:peptidoglycan/xylan/chitin deacetylase (PgdA/CDA1 family)